MIVFLILCDIHLVYNPGRCDNESCLCERQKHGFERPLWQIPDQTQVTGDVFTTCKLFAMDISDESEKVVMEIARVQVDELQNTNIDSKEIPKKKIVSVPPVVSVEKKRTSLDGEEKEASPKTRPVLVKAVSADTGDKANLEFYTDCIPSQPEGAKISVIHEQWAKNYELLESHHGFIQWLFPLHEDNGVNHFARKLTKWEASQMIEDETIARRILTSYKMMLGFYGMKLKDEVTGEIVRATDHRTRYRNLLSNPHNNLRINRILLSLGYLGFQRYRKPFVDFLRKEVMEEKKLPSCRVSFTNFWSKTLQAPAAERESVFFKDKPLVVPRRSARFSFMK